MKIQHQIHQQINLTTPQPNDGNVSNILSKLYFECFFCYVSNVMLGAKKTLIYDLITDLNRFGDFSFFGGGPAFAFKRWSQRNQMGCTGGAGCHQLPSSWPPYHDQEPTKGMLVSEGQIKNAAIFWET